MKPEDFLPLGLNLNEARVYLSLIQNAKATASTIIKHLGVHRNIVYDNLDKLSEKGLVSFVIEKGKRIYFPKDPSTIIDYLNQEKEQVNKKIVLANKLTKQLEQELNTHSQSGVELFQGIQGIKRVLELTLKNTNSTRYVIGISNYSTEVLGKTYWNNYNKKTQDKKIKNILLLNPDYNETTSMIKTHKNTIRILPNKASQKVEINLFDKKVALIVYSTKPTAVLIQDEHIYQTYLLQFNQLWQASSNLSKTL